MGVYYIMPLSIDLPVAVAQPRKLTFLYLANDVIQNSKKKGPEFSQEFEGNSIVNMLTTLKYMYIR